MRILFLALALVSQVALAEKSVILKQQQSYLLITKYEAAYEPEYRGSYDSHSDQIKHTIKLMNTAGKAIVAYQIGLGAFDAFNTFMDRFSGWSIENIEPQGSADGIWTQSPYAAFSFQNFGTGFAYVHAIRFADGTIWKADMAEVLAELQKFEKSLTKDDIKEKKERP